MRANPGIRGRVLPAVVITAAGLVDAAPAEPPITQAAEIVWIASGEFCEPETVLPLPDQTLLVSNVCDFRQRGNGFLTLMRRDGSVIDWRRVDGLDAPLGMTMLGEKLYVIDANRVRVLRWPDYAALRIIELATRVANDIAAAPDGTLYVTDTATGGVAVIEPAGRQSLLTRRLQFPGANGIALSGRFLYVGGRRAWRIDLDNLGVRMVGPEWLSDIDGIEFESDGTPQFSLVGGPLVRPLDDDSAHVLGGAHISSTNHASLPGLAVIPTGFDNTVVAIRIP